MVRLLELSFEVFALPFEGDFENVVLLRVAVADLLAGRLKSLKGEKKGETETSGRAF